MAAEKPHYVVIDDCRESGRRCDLLVVGVESAASAIRPPTCLEEVSVGLVGFFKG